MNLLVLCFLALHLLVFLVYSAAVAAPGNSKVFKIGIEVEFSLVADKIPCPSVVETQRKPIPIESDEAKSSVEDTVGGLVLDINVVRRSR